MYWNTHEPKDQKVHNCKSSIPIRMLVHKVPYREKQKKFPSLWRNLCKGNSPPPWRHVMTEKRNDEGIRAHPSLYHVLTEERIDE